MSRRLKILHMPAWYPSNRNPVAGIFIKEHVKAASIYHDCVVLYGEGVDQNIRGTCEIRESDEDGVRTVRFRYKKSPVPKTTMFIYLFVMFNLLHDLLKRGFKPDLIHAHIYSAGALAVLFGKLYNIPLVVSEQYTGFPRGLVKGIELVKAHIAFKNAACVCPVSEYLKLSIQDLGIRVRFQVIPNVADTKLFHPIRNLSERHAGKKRILTVALLTPKKGIPDLLESLALLKA
ncbi:glycosyltransferase, partial [Thermoflexus sp.]|uniref:glycosyltransferase n=1 Tax=Thermoflexus sp. TaxID=1969742 RepID=UPI002ADE4878